MTVQEFNQCVDQYSDNVYRFILKQIKNEEKAKDIVQSTYEKLWIKSDGVAFNKAKSYIFSTAYHTMIDSIRKDRRIEEMDETSVYEPAYSDEYKGINEVLEAGLKKLPEVQRTAILLRDYEGYSYEEIGEITKLNESQVKVYIYRARKTMKEFIGNLEQVL
ncbi:MAG: RNA polymerase sigma factor [Bacteroidota bacterium]